MKTTTRSDSSVRIQKTASAFLKDGTINLARIAAAMENNNGETTLKIKMKSDLAARQFRAQLLEKVRLFSEVIQIH